mgnify:FL=1
MKKKIIIVLVAIVLGFLLGIGIHFLTVYFKEKKELSNIKELVDNYNQFNRIYEDVTEALFVNQFDYECFKYEGDKIDDVKNKANEVFEYAFRNEGNLDEVDGDIYICKPKNCKIKKIDDYKVRNVNANRKILSVDTDQIVIEKVDNMWKFVIYYPLCEK